ncbi:Uncharacterised protein [Streptococcus pseudoporcinus]|uniref:Uncharacterized protein n=1 Tax=Streptococcus pseudoporcinus TaxID=361101 RepID=A0A4U9YZC7_9STRE|nr:Uncharacterised protein [Streptococcus pseudoporcinus]
MVALFARGFNLYDGADFDPKFEDYTYQDGAEFCTQLENLKDKYPILQTKLAHLKSTTISNVL